ncbi:hypothetical protein V6N11_027426 [Hibiscus sabdariffa]|uniref:Uncharacterized protein n=1 Tax=Hibiscus sabdariffa TaxID=183260 RepID=A0ABR2PGW5_9ROSI
MILSNTLDEYKKWGNCSSVKGEFGIPSSANGISTCLCDVLSTTSELLVNKTYLCKWQSKSKSQNKIALLVFQRFENYSGNKLKTDAGAIPQIPFCALKRAMVGPRALRLRALYDQALLPELSA